jgi:hypothetical protein
MTCLWFVSLCRRHDGTAFVENLNLPLTVNQAKLNVQQILSNSQESQPSTTPLPQVPAKPEVHKSRSVPLLFSFNGKTDGDAKKCWPIDIAVLEDGTPIITDFHNMKIKAFDPSGCVVHHGIALLS